MGDLGVLADLKKKMDNAGEAAAEKLKAAAPSDDAPKPKVAAEPKSEEISRDIAEQEATPKDSE